MRKAHIVLADTGLDYVSMFELRFLERYGDRAELQIISDADYFNEFFSHPQELALLIVNEALFTPALSRHAIPEIIRLSEDQPSPSQARDEYGPTLYKYSPIKRIFAEIEPYLMTGSGSGSAVTQTICFYSPAGGTGVTTVALGLAGALSKHNRKVLYLDTQPIQSSQTILQSDSFLPHDLLSTIVSDDESASSIIQSACGHRVFDYLRPLDHVTTVYGIGTEQYRRLIGTLKRAALYDYIVIDCSSDFTVEKSQLISECDKVVLVSTQSGAACWKTRALLKDITVRTQGQFMAFCNRYRKDQPDQLKESLPSKVFSAGYLGILSDETCTNLEQLSSVPELAMLALSIL